MKRLNPSLRLKSHKNSIGTNINPKKSPDYNQINPKIPKELPKRAMIHLTRHIFDAIQTEYATKHYKRANAINMLYLNFHENHRNK
jgi:hypothetical protein